MTLGKATAFGACLIAAMGFGIWVSPHVMQGDELLVPASEDTSDIGTPAPADARPVTTGTPAARVVSAREALPPIAVDDPALHAQVQGLLNEGADVGVAADGFDRAPDFVAVVYAARNTGVPFMLLKHRVTVEGMTLADAIEASQPSFNGTLEAERAAAEAWSDLARIAG